MDTSFKIPFLVIERFSLRNDISLNQSIQIHEDLLKYLDAGHLIKSKDHSPSKIIDEAWHSFILHTKVYQDFCMSRYGEFIHHFPLSNELDKFSKVKQLIEIGNRDNILQTANCTCNNKCSNNSCGNSDN